MPENIVDKDKRGFGWNFNTNKLLFNNIYQKDQFINFDQFNLNKNYFEKIAQKFKNQINLKIHPNPMLSRLFYNSIMLGKWINKH